MNRTTLLFAIILIEGYVVLACELLAIRQLIPFVGSGTEVISIIISAVLLPLAIGYHRGGSAYSPDSQVPVRDILLRNILMALAILAFGLSYAFLELFFGMLGHLGITDRLAQTALYCGLFLVAPVFLLGQTVPLVSNYFPPQRLSAITGKMLFFSTAGSFLGSVFSTIVLMSTVGVHNTVIVTLGLLTLLVFLLSGFKKTFEIVISLVLFAMVWGMNSSELMRAMHIVSDNAYNTVSIEYIDKEDSTIFNINRSSSSKLSSDPKNHFGYWHFIEGMFIKPIAQGEPKDILIIGAGGFTLGLNDINNHYTFVDIDKDLKNVAETHFLHSQLTANKEFVAASAREFVHRDGPQYDMIIIDTYTNAVSIPMETTTREFLIDIKKRLKPDGIVLANVIGSPNFSDKFTVRYHNTFNSVFPASSRQLILPYNGWDDSDHTINAIYIYHNHAVTEDRGIYTDDKNTYSLDR